MTIAVCRNGSYFGPVTTVAVGTSPQIFVNPESYTVRLMVAGGVLSDLALSADGSTYFSMGLGGGLVLLNAGESAKITWLVTAPTGITYVPF